MSKIKFIAVAVILLAACTSAFAQNTEKKNSIFVQYNPSKLKADGASKSFTSFSLGYSKTFDISQETPLFLEVGGAIQFSTYSNGEHHKEKFSFNFYSLKIPVNFGYTLQVNDNIAVAPYVGLTARGNVYGRGKSGYERGDLFGDEFDWKRFQVGWQVGANVKFLNSFFVGYSFGTDFNKIAQKTKVQTHSITLGLSF